MKIIKSRMKKHQTEMDPGNVGMKNLIRSMNDIIDACSQVGLSMQFNLPQIAVIGSQSTGKSSVLESIVGR